VAIPGRKPIPRPGFLDTCDYLGFSRKALPAIVAARQRGRSLAELAAEHLAELQGAAVATDRSAIYVLSHWLARHG